MHKYLGAVGFCELHDKKKLKEILTDAVMTSSERGYIQLDDGTKVAMMSKRISPSLGISVCGEYDEDGHFIYEYYFPFLQSYIRSLEEEISVERHASQVSFAGVCEEMSFGTILIFYLQNFIGYFTAKKEQKLKNSYVSLTGLSVNGRILLPLSKNEAQRKTETAYAKKRKNLIKDARKGLESAIESLSMQDMGLYNTICKKILESDVYSLVDTTFIPCGVESDHYAVLGEITNVKKETNMYSNESVYILTMNCNGVMMDVAINENDLMGEPAVGRRFKGDIWLQGSVHIQE